MKRTKQPPPVPPREMLAVRLPIGLVNKIRHVRADAGMPLQEVVQRLIEAGLRTGIQS